MLVKLIVISNFAKVNTCHNLSGAVNDFTMQFNFTVLMNSFGTCLLSTSEALKKLTDSRLNTSTN